MSIGLHLAKGRGAITGAWPPRACRKAIGGAAKRGCHPAAATASIYLRFGEWQKQPEAGVFNHCWT